MVAVAEALGKSRLLSHLEPRSLAHVLEQAVQVSGETGTPISARGADVVIVVTGSMEMKSREGKLLATINANQASGEVGVLQAIPSGARLTLVGPSELLILDGSVLDAALTQQHQEESVQSLDGVIAERVSALIRTPPFTEMTLDQICRSADAMEEISVDAGQEIIRYADRGDKFYVIRSGEAEVWRADVRTGANTKVATLGPGASFGEEALLHGGLRNATVKMSKAGQLYALNVDAFNELLAGHLVREIDPAAAQSLIQRGLSELIDCRYEDEHEVWRIPGSRLLPLDKVRERARELDRETQYLVYCRTGRRSRVAAFLLGQMGFQCSVLRGGISSWPYEFEGSPFEPPPGTPTI